MFKIKVLLLATFAVIFLTNCTNDFKNSDTFNNSQVKSDYIVVLKKSHIQSLFVQNQHNLAQKDLVVSTLNDLSTLSHSEVVHSFHLTIMGGLMKLTKEQSEILAKDPRVAYIEKDQKISLNNTQINPTWGLDRIDQESLPLNQTYEFKSEASNVNVYVIDTGILTTHTDFEGRAFHGVDTVDSDRDATDCNGHGTHVAGTIGGKRYGVAKKVKLYGIRVLDCVGSGTYSSVIAGVEWVTANHTKPAIANMSLGGPASQALDDAIRASISNGIIYVVAAGNENTNACNSSPARITEAITVGSTDSQDRRSSFSNHGNCVDIFAPGSDILSAWYNSNNATATLSGTSMAAPHVAGVTAMFMSIRPQANPNEVSSSIITNSVKDKLSQVLSSPNRMLNTAFIGQELDLENNVLQNGVNKKITSSPRGEELHYRLILPSGVTSLEVRIFGGAGDADLYVKSGLSPTLNQYDCRPYKNGNEETCNFVNPNEGEYHIMIRAYSSYSNLQLVANYALSTQQPPNPCPVCEIFSGVLNHSGDRQYQPNGNYYQTLKSSTHNYTLEGPVNTNFDLHLYRWSGSDWIEVARSIGTKSNEKINYFGAPGYYLIEVRSLSGAGNYQLYRQIQY